MLTLYNINGDKMKKIASLFIAALLISGCASNKPLTKHDFQTLNAGFDTIISLIGYTSSEEEFEKYSNLVQSEFSRYNALFDKYNNYENINNIKTINDNAGIKPVKVDPEIIELMELSKTFSDLSENQFDITIGPVLEIWHDYRELGMVQNQKGDPTLVPTIEELTEAKVCTGWDKVEIDEEASTVYLNQSCASLDVGSVAKGFAAEKVASSLQAQGLNNGIVNAGGNVRVIGTKPESGGQNWKAGIQIPDLNGAGGSLGVMELSGTQSLVTSGDYQRYYLYGDEVMHHIIDPHTLFPAKHARAVSIITDNSGVADICSTLMFTLTYEEGIEMIEQIRALGYPISVIWVYDETFEIPSGVETFKYLDYTIVTTDDIHDAFLLQK